MRKRGGLLTFLQLPDGLLELFDLLAEAADGGSHFLEMMPQRGISRLMRPSPWKGGLPPLKFPGLFP